MSRKKNSARLKVVGGWMIARRMETVGNVLKIRDLNKSAKERILLESLLGKYEVLNGGYVERVEKE